MFLITFNDFLLFSAAKIMIVFDILVRQHSVFCKTLIFLKMCYTKCFCFAHGEFKLIN